MLQLRCALIRELRHIVPLFSHLTRELSMFVNLGGQFDPALGLIGTSLGRPIKPVSLESVSQVPMIFSRPERLRSVNNPDWCIGVAKLNITKTIYRVLRAQGIQFLDEGDTAYGFGVVLVGNSGN